MSRPTRRARDELEAKVCASISDRFGTAVTLLNAAFADRLGLNATDFKCMAILGRTGAITAGHLAELAAMSTPATTLVVARLERAGLVGRERDPDDRRRVILRPVADAALGADLAAHHAELVRSMQALTAQYSERDLVAIGGFLDQASVVLEVVGRQLRDGAPRTGTVERAAPRASAERRASTAPRRRTSAAARTSRRGRAARASRR
jgi:DNA-binding MarR family transcriptional regulator